MRVQLNRKGRVSLPLFTAILTIALAFTFNACDSGGDRGGDDGTGGGSGGLGGKNAEWYEHIKEKVKYYDPDDGEMCEAGVTKWLCKTVSDGDKWYNPLTHVCHTSLIYLDPKLTLIRTLAEWKTCGNGLYITIFERCQGGVVEDKCETVDGDKWYNFETHYCMRNGPEPGIIIAKERCGSKYYLPQHSLYYANRCNNGVVEETCGFDSENDIFYNYETHYCDHTTVKPLERCGNKYIYPKEERCNNGVVENGCWSNIEQRYTDWYNGITQSCNIETGEVKDKKKCE
jgi:hypothetical protein